MALARLNPEYAMRLSGVGVLLVMLAAWSLYDGAIAWPKANSSLAEIRPTLIEKCHDGVTPEMWLAPTEDASGRYLLKDVFENAGLSLPKNLVQEISEITRPEGMSVEACRSRADQAAEVFARDIYPRGKCNGQYAQAVVLVILALFAFRAVLSKRGVEYTVDDEGLRGTGFGGAAVAWDDVMSVDWGKWSEKGVITIKTKDGKSFVLDGWHFKGVRDIAAELEKRFPSK